MPDFVDSLIVVDDCSSDSTIATVKALAATNARVHLIEHEHNEGIDVTVVMAGDAQMDPGDLPAIIGPVARDEVDYCKGNRLFTGEAFGKIPKIRYFGNAVLSLLTKVASGYWHVFRFPDRLHSDQPQDAAVDRLGSDLEALRLSERLPSSFEHLQCPRARCTGRRPGIRRR